MGVSPDVEKNRRESQPACCFKFMYNFNRKLIIQRRKQVSKDTLKNTIKILS